MKKILLILLVFISLTTVGFSIDNEFKNELTKVDIVKVSDGNYRIDLYTKNPYMGSVKAIKKGKNSYNILLPETDNSITASASNSDTFTSSGSLTIL